MKTSIPATPSRTTAQRHVLNRGVMLLVALAFVTMNGRAGTIVCGPAFSETWTKANSPYLVTCNVLVGDLVIEAGVQVLFEGNYTFEVGGVLTVAGMSNSPVVFTRTNGGWQGIYFNYSSPGSELRYAEISGAVNSGVRIVNSAPVFRHCSFFENSALGDGGAISASISNGDLFLEGCRFKNNTSAGRGGGIYANLANGSLIALGNDCSGNRSSFSGGGMFVSLGAGHLQMLDCFVQGNVANPNANSGDYVAGGIYINGRAVLLGCDIDGNKSYSACSAGFPGCLAVGRGGGAYLTGSALISNCHFRSNEVSAVGHILQGCSWPGRSSTYGGGIYFELGDLELRNSILADNLSLPSSDCPNVSVQHAGGLYINSGTCRIINVTAAYNSGHGIEAGGGTTSVTNSIVYFNGNGGGQIAGPVTLAYSDVQNGFPGTGNIDFQPIFRNRTNLMIISASRCKDAGDFNPIFNDACFPPSLGTARNDMGAHGGPGACCWEEKCTGPVIRNQPNNTVACIAADAAFCVSATGTAPLTYQWRFHGLSPDGAPGDIFGATNACLAVSNVQSNNAGYYSARVANSLGSVNSQAALLTVTPACINLELYAGLTISGGVPGQTYRIQTISHVNDSNWTTRTTITQSAAGYFWLDPEPAVPQRRFYRVVP